MSAHAGKRRWGGRRLQWVLLLLALLTSPALCCSATLLLDALPSFGFNLFEGQVRVANRTEQTVYLTAITTVHGEPEVILQPFRMRDIPLRPQHSVTLQYDTADLPLAGVAVCRTADDCRLVPETAGGVYELRSYESLERLDPTWQAAIRSAPRYNVITLLVTGTALLSISLFTAWGVLVRRGTSGVT